MTTKETLPIVVWDQAYNRNGDPKLPRAVVNAIRTHMDNHTLTGWVKAATLARYTGLQERAVWKQIRANVKAGWLEVVQSGNSSGWANTYRLTYPPGTLSQRTGSGEILSQKTGEPCPTGQVNPVPEDIPTTPVTTPGSSPKRRTTPENPVPQDRVSTDPYSGSGGVSLPVNPEATELDPVLQDRVSEGVPQDRVSERRERDPWASHRWEQWDPFATAPADDESAPEAVTVSGQFDPFT